MRGACAQVWPPLLVDQGWTAAAGLDRSLFSTIVRKDGTRQLVAGQWPLYTFSGDTKPGDVNGEGSGGVWFAVGATGKFVKNAPASATDDDGEQRVLEQRVLTDAARLRDGRCTTACVVPRVARHRSLPPGTGASLA